MGFVRSKPILSSINHSKNFKSKTRRVVKEIKCKKVKITFFKKNKKIYTHTHSYKLKFNSIIDFVRGWSK